jgi:Na+/proline symporter
MPPLRVLSPIDVGIVVAFVVASVGAGLAARARASESLEEYFLAGRTLRGWQAGASMAATQFAADTPLLVTGLIATAGIFALWRLWIYAVAFLLLGFVFAPLWRRAGVLTDAALCELRYGGEAAFWLRVVKAVYFGTIFNCTVLAMVLWAAMGIAEPFLRWEAWLPGGLFEAIEALVRRVGVPFALGPADAGDVWVRSSSNLISVVALVLFTSFYSLTGGLRGVVRTDLLQLALMLGGTGVYAAYVVDAVGGLAGLPDALARALEGAGPDAPSADQVLAFTPSRAREAGLAVLAVLGLQWLVQMNADGTGYLAQRAMACRSDRDARIAAVVFTGLQVVLRSLLWLPIGVGLLVLYPLGAAQPIDVAAREATFVRGMADLLPPGVLGLMLTAMLAALASTVDTHLNWGAAYWTEDLYRRLLCERVLGRSPSRRELVRVARLANPLILVVALAIMTRLSSIQAAWHLSLLLGAGMGLPLVLRWAWWRITARGELAAMLASAMLAPWLMGIVESEALRLLWVAVVSAAMCIFASIALGPEPWPVLEAFHRRVRPSGFWSPVASRCGGDARADRRRLGQGFAAAALGALCTGCLLVGLGSALVGGRAPAWWPLGRGVWIGSNLVVGLALIGPLVKHALRREEA